MGKYRSWSDSLRAIPPSQQTATQKFSDIEREISEGLPASARKYRQWWANESASASHTQARAWLDAGWEVQAVDLLGETVTFRRKQ